MKESWLIGNREHPDAAADARCACGPAEYRPVQPTLTDGGEVATARRPVGLPSAQVWGSTCQHPRPFLAGPSRQIREALLPARLALEPLTRQNRPVTLSNIIYYLAPTGIARSFRADHGVRYGTPTNRQRPTRTVRRNPVLEKMRIGFSR